MALDTSLLFKVLSPRIMNRAIQTFDRSTTVVVSVCWAAALLMTVFSIYTLTLAISAGKEADNAVTAEPILPKVKAKNIENRKMQAIVERMQRRYPDINISLQTNQALNISALDGAKFRDWLSALSYIDVISPQYHWKILSFCVGKCRSGELMSAILKGEQITFETPKTEGKDKEE